MSKYQDEFSAPSIFYFFSKKPLKVEQNFPYEELVLYHYSEDEFQYPRRNTFTKFSGYFMNIYSNKWNGYIPFRLSTLYELHLPHFQFTYFAE